MRNRRAHRWVMASAAVAFALALAAAPARAQQTTPPGAPLPGNRDPFAEARERQQREAQLRGAERLGVPRTKAEADTGAALEQMKDDFKGIQLQRNKLVRHLQSAKPLDYKLIAEEAEAINKRAGRLRHQLVREQAEKKEPEKPVEISDEQLKDALYTICKRIDSFTENPIFKVPSVVDVEQSAKADRDLRHILLLSGGVKRAAERLDKTHKR